MVLHSNLNVALLARYIAKSRGATIGPTGSDASTQGPPDLPKSDIVPEPKTK